MSAGTGRLPVFCWSVLSPLGSPPSPSSSATRCTAHTRARASRRHTPHCCERPAARTAQSQGTVHIAVDGNTAAAAATATTHAAQPRLKPQSLRMPPLPPPPPLLCALSPPALLPPPLAPPPNAQGHKVTCAHLGVARQASLNHGLRGGVSAHAGLQLRGQAFVQAWQLRHHAALRPIARSARTSLRAREHTFMVGVRHLKRRRHPRVPKSMLAMCTALPMCCRQRADKYASEQI
jgi:hypothetical protein